MILQEKILQIENELERTQKNKATMKHLCLLKAKLAKFKRDIILKKISRNKIRNFDIRKINTARVGIIGFPSVGKSTLLCKLTNTKSESSNYGFTTLICISGNLSINDCKIQLLDLPGIIEGAKNGRGKGKQVIGVARTCDILLIILDSSKPLTHKNIIKRELEGFGIRLNKNCPKINIKKTTGGGIQLIKIVKQTKLKDNIIISICKEYKYFNCELILNQDCSAEDIIDVLCGRVIYIPFIYCLNMIDKITVEELDVLSRIPRIVPISGKYGWNLDVLKDKIWNYLNLTRIYTKPRGRLPNYSHPIILTKKHKKVQDFCTQVHKKLLDKLKYAWIWGSSVKHQPQKVGKEHQLADEDIIQIIK